MGEQPVDLTVSELLRRQARERGGKLAYRFLPDGERESRAVTYQALDRHARQVAARLSEHCRPGDRALILVDGGIDFVEAFLGCQHAGVIAVPAAIPMPIGSRRKLETLAAVARDSGAGVVLTAGPARIRDTIRAGAPALAALPWLDVEDARTGGDDFEPVAGRPDDVSFLQYTSGSTALPKGVMVTHRALAANERLQAHVMGTTDRDVIVCWMPLFHDAGLIAHTLHGLHLGAETVLMPPLAFAQRPRRWLQAITTYGGTMSGGPNFAFDLCLRRIPAAERDGLDLRTWRRAFNGAEPVRAGTLEQFAEAFGPYGFDPAAAGPSYGLAECTVYGTGPQPWSGPTVLDVSLERLQAGRLELGGGHRIVGCGRAALHRRVVVVDPGTGRPRPDGEVGEIWLSGEDLAAGYWGRPAATAETFGARLAPAPGEPADPTPFLRTGDLGLLHEGELYVTGRLKDLLIVGGRNHYPQDVEQTIEAVHGWIRNNCCAVFALDTGEREQVVAVAELLPGTEDAEPVPLEELRRRIRAAVTAEHGIDLDDVVLVRPGSVPKTSSGKLQRSACRAAYQEGELTPVRTTAAELEGAR